MRRWIALGVSLAILAGVAVVGWKVWEYVHMRITPERCTVANGDGEPVTLTAEQARMTSIIVAASHEAGLSERAAVIALATAYQESGIRNLDYGDRDSLGLFQQRPDPRFDWGTAEQIMDPWYSSARFYEELVKFPDWETTDVNDQAQKVQRSGFPEAYRKHVPNATALAAAARGSAPEAITCVQFAEPVADASPIEEVVSRVPGTQVSVDGREVRITADSQEHLWSATNLAMLNFYDAGISRVQVEDRVWKRNHSTWDDAREPVDGAVITLG